MATRTPNNLFPLTLVGAVLLVAVVAIAVISVASGGEFSLGSDNLVGNANTNLKPGWCTLEASQAQSGQGSLLRWQADNNAISGTISPAVPGFVYAANGIATSGALTQDTVFTLTISNGAGSYSCKATATVVGTTQFNANAQGAGINPSSCASCSDDQVCINGQCAALPSCTSMPGQFCATDDDGTPGLLERTTSGMGTCPQGQYCMRCRGNNVVSGNSCVPGPGCTACQTSRLGPAVAGEPSGIPNSCSGNNLITCGFDGCSTTTACSGGCARLSDGSSTCR